MTEMMWFSGFNGDEVRIVPAGPLMFYKTTAPNDVVGKHVRGTARHAHYLKLLDLRRAPYVLGVVKYINPVFLAPVVGTAGTTSITLETNAAVVQIVVQPPARVVLGALAGMVYVKVTTESGAPVGNTYVYASVARVDNTSFSVHAFFRGLSVGKLEKEHSNAVISPGQDVATTNKFGIAQFPVKLSSGIAGAYFRPLIKAPALY